MEPNQPDISESRMDMTEEDHGLSTTRSFNPKSIAPIMGNERVRKNSK